jgi:hypothetical protein
VNTWALLARIPAASLDCSGKLSSSLISSVERLRRGEIVSVVLKDSLRSMVSSSSEHEPATKMARFQTGSPRGDSKEIAVAKVIAVMYQSLFATAKSSTVLEFVSSFFLK